jgi:hypothetical protein
MEPEFRARLEAHFSPYDEIPGGDMGNLANNMFDSQVERVADYQEEDWQGTGYTLYRFENLFFIIEYGFGSCEGCDQWMSSPEEYLIPLRSDILDDVVPFSDLSQAIDSTKYCHPEWRSILEKTLERFQAEEKDSLETSS